MLRLARTSRLAILVTLAAAASTAAGTNAAAPAGASALSPELAETLRWFPADVNALLVAQQFDMPTRYANVFLVDPGVDPLALMLAQLTLGEPLRTAVPETYDALSGRRVEFAVQASRDHFPNSAFGSTAYAGCHVVRFAEPLGDVAATVAAALRKGADEIVTLSGREVAVFPWKFSKEPYLKDRPWEALLVVLPKADDRELMFATQRELLEQTLTRRDAPDATREALPPTLDAWNGLDVSAQSWAILAAPRADNNQPSAIDVMTWEYRSGDESRFILRSPAALMPEVAPKKSDSTRKEGQVGPASLLDMLDSVNTSYVVERPTEGPVQVTVRFADAMAKGYALMPLAFVTAGLFQFTIEPRP